MAIVIPGPLASSIHGSIGGANYYTHNGRQIARRKPQPLKKYSKAQADVRSYFRRGQVFTMGPGLLAMGIKYSSWATLTRRSRFGLEYGYSVINYGTAFYFYSRFSNTYSDRPGLNTTPTTKPARPKLKYGFLDSPSRLRIYVYTSFAAGEFLHVWNSHPVDGYSSYGKRIYRQHTILSAPVAGYHYILVMSISGRGSMHIKTRMFKRGYGLAEPEYQIVRHY